MKRLILILSVVFSLISCSKDSNQTTLDRLCNKWELTRWEHYKEGVLETTQEGNFTTQFYTFSKEGTVKIIKNDGSVAEYTFSFNEDTQILTIPKLNHEYKVLSVSGTDMKWQYDSWAIGGNGPIEYQSYYYLKRRS